MLQSIYLFTSELPELSSGEGAEGNTIQVLTNTWLLLADD